MVEGGLMSSAPCSSAVSDCNFGDCCGGEPAATVEAVSHRTAPCYRIRPRGSDSEDGGGAGGRQK